jgi:hypothetical protein
MPTLIQRRTIALSRRIYRMMAKRINEISVIAILAVVLLIFAPHGLAAKDIGSAILAGISTLIGAIYAFRLSERKEKEGERAKRIHALNKALFSLGRQVNAIRYIREEVSPYDTDMKRLFGCKAAMPPDYSDVRVDFESLSFLLDTNDPDLLLRLSVEQDGFHQVIRAISMRAQYFVDQFQPAVMASGIMTDPITTTDLIMLNDAREKIGSLVFDSALNYTTSMFTALDEALPRLQKIMVELEDLSRQIYPGERFLRLTLQNDKMHNATEKFRM